MSAVNCDFLGCTACVDCSLLVVAVRLITWFSQLSASHYAFELGLAILHQWICNSPPTPMFPLLFSRFLNLLACNCIVDASGSLSSLTSDAQDAQDSRPTTLPVAKLLKCLILCISRHLKTYIEWQIQA